MIKKISILATLLLLTSLSFAQQGWEAGGWLGVSNYYGDLNTNYRFDDVNLAGGIIARYNFNNRISLKFGGNYGRVAADDKKSTNNYEKVRNLNFRSDILEGMAALEINFLPYTHGSRDEFFTPYIFFGASVFNFNPEGGRDTDGDGEYDEWLELQILGTEGQFQGEEYFTVSGAFVYGLGFKVDVSTEWSLNVAVSSRALFTDYLDDVSTTYPDMGDLENLRGADAVFFSDRSSEVAGESIGILGRQRGNSTTNDFYAFFQVGIVRYFGDIKCPTP